MTPALTGMPEYADLARALRAMIGDGPGAVSRELIETLEERGIPFRIADRQKAQLFADALTV